MFFYFFFADVFENVTFSHHELVRNKEYPVLKQ